MVRVWGHRYCVQTNIALTNELDISTDDFITYLVSTCGCTQKHCLDSVPYYLPVFCCCCWEVLTKAASVLNTSQFTNYRRWLLMGQCNHHHEGIARNSGMGLSTTLGNFAANSYQCGNYFKKKLILYQKHKYENIVAILLQRSERNHWDVYFGLRISLGF